MIQKGERHLINYREIIEDEESPEEKFQKNMTKKKG